MITVEEALGHVFRLARPVGSETVALRDAAGRVLTAPVTANRDQPPFAASAMDGYALCDADHRPGVRLRVIGQSAAGRRFAGPCAPGEAVRIFTGAPIPDGAERVVLQEDVESRSDGVDEIIILGPGIDSNTHIRPAGQDFRIGDALSAPRLLGHRDLALIAAMNVAQVSVSRRPSVALIATGDELVMPGEAPGPDQIIASNTFALAAMAEAAGAEVRMLPIARDTEASLRFTLDLAAEADLIVTIGGASVGDHDLVGRVAEQMGLERAFYKIAMRPGKPLMAGRLGRSTLLGLPGNPVSAIVCGHLFMLPALRAMQGLPAIPTQTVAGILGADVPANGPRAHYMRARLDTCTSPPTIVPFARQDSALLSILSEARALLVRPMNDPARSAGDAVSFIPI